jgi:hypothetical protein
LALDLTRAEADGEKESMHLKKAAAVSEGRRPVLNNSPILTPVAESADRGGCRQ